MDMKQICDVRLFSYLLSYDGHNKVRDYIVLLITRYYKHRVLSAHLLIFYLTTFTVTNQSLNNVIVF